MQTKGALCNRALCAKLYDMGIDIEDIICDFEVAQKQAIEEAFPGLKLRACLWHFRKVMQ